MPDYHKRSLNCVIMKRWMLILSNNVYSYLGAYEFAFSHENYIASRSDYRMVQSQVACIYFNSLPEHIRNCTNFKHFSKDTFNYLFNQVYNVDSTQFYCNLVIVVLYIFRRFLFLFLDNIII